MNNLAINEKLNRNKRFYSYVLGLATTLYGAYYLAKFASRDIYPDEVAINNASIFLLCTYAFCAYAWIKSTKKLISPFFILFISCFAFNAGQVMLNVFNLEINSWYDIYSVTDSDILMKSLCFQTVCVFGMTFGAIIGSKPVLELKKESYKYCLKREDSRYDWVDKAFIFLAFVVLYEYVHLLLVRGDAAYASGEERAGPLFYYVKYTFIIILYYQLYRHNHSKWKKLTWILGGFLALAIFLLGARYAIMPVVLGLAFVVFAIRNTRFDLTFKQKLLLIAAAILFISLMRGWTTLRKYPLSEINWELIRETYSEGLITGFYDTFAEMGKTFNTLTNTVTAVDMGDVGNDRTILYASFLGAVPEKIADVLGLTPTITSLAAWVTEYMGAKNGQGYSLFAEAYFNYHNFGFLFMILFGYLYIKLENQATKLFYSDSASLTMLGCGMIYLLSYACFLARADFILMSSYIRFILYICIAIVIKRRGKIFSIYKKK